MTKRSKNYGLAYGICMGVVVAITYGIAIEVSAIGISIGLGSGITFGAALSQTKNSDSSLSISTNKNSLTFVWFFVCINPDFPQSI